MRRVPAVVAALALGTVAAAVTLGIETVPPLSAVVAVAAAAAVLALLAVVGAVGHREPPSFDAGTVVHRAPGDDVDALLAALSAGGRTDPPPRRRELRARLEAVAVDVVARRFDCSPDAARRRLSAGDWTDDPVAAAYFADRPVGRAGSLRALATGDPPVRRRARRAIDELHRLETTGDGPTDGAAPGVGR